ncbi:MAG TPA: FAD-binding protein [Spirochaetales bacterium]|nr:FAD-binding protein [Spirochaetales bacterium]
MSVEQRFDVVIIGGGPAGSTLARLLGTSRSVLVVERSGGDTAGRPQAQKCCGGLLDPDAQRMLATFGLGVPRQVLVGPQLFAVRAVDLASGLERHYQRHYVNIDRGAMDEWLLSLAARSATVARGATFRTFRPGRDGLTVRYTVGGQPVEVRAGLLVGADGAWSAVRRALRGSSSQRPGYVAIQEWYPNHTVSSCFEALFHPAVTDFYAWTIPKDGKLILGAALPADKDPAARFELLKRLLVERGWELGAPALRHGTHLARPSRPGVVDLGAGTVALVGEAAGLISPSSAEGFSYAFRSALSLAQALGPGQDGWLGRYTAANARLRAELAVKALKLPVMYQPWLRRLALASGALSVDRVDTPISRPQ